ncbi:MAG: winged helix DNA-binding domain-containing protein [Vicinamibacterales bacterium]
MSSLLTIRLRHQGLKPVVHSAPEAVVRTLGAVQSQDYLGAAWALALRAKGVNLADVDRALAEGRIVRTHVLRPTWHFVAPQDLRWMQALTGPRVRRLMRSYDARLELDAKLYAKARRAIAKALERQGAMTRAQVATALASAGIAATGQRLAHVMMDAELDAVICSGPRRGAQMTYVLVDAIVPPTPVLTHDEALAALASRYFESHGPATAHDFAWWSGLTLGDARRGVEAAGVGDLMLAAPPSTDRAAGGHFLVSNYDEYFIAYRHRDAVLDRARARNVGIWTTAEYPHQIVLHGRVAGSWRREVTPKHAVITLRFHETPAPAEQRAIHAIADRFGRFLGVPCAVRH